MGDPHTVPTLAAPRVRPAQRRDHTGGTHLRTSRQAQLQLEYTALGRTEHATATDDGQASASGAADQTPEGRGAPGSGERVEAGTNTASEPTGLPPGTALPWGRGHLDYTRLEGNASRPSDQAEQAADQDLGLWINRLTAEEQLALAVRIRLLLTSRSRHLAEGTRTMADITFGHRTGHTPPASMSSPSQWHYVATQFMAHMGAYSRDEMTVQPCSSTTSGTSLGPQATKGTPQATDGRGPRTPQSLPGRRHAITPQNAHGATTRIGFPHWHVQKPPATVRPAEGPR